jgi:integrase
MVQTLKPPTSNLRSRSWRLEQTIRKRPYFETVEYRVLLGYRRTKGNGTWVVRVTKDGSDWTKRIGTADDYKEAIPGTDILTHSQARDEAKKVANVGKPDGDNTVKAALDRYETDLKGRGADLGNIVRVRAYLTDSDRLAKKAVGSLTKADLAAWRDGLKDEMAPASVNRTMTALRAALNLAAEDGGGRIANREAWKTGLKAVSGTGKARNVILDEHDMRTVIGAAYRASNEFGLLVELAAVTGARPSQLLRLRGEEVQANFTDPNSKKRQPRLLMPVSRKGRGEKKATHRPVPIPEALAKRLSNLSHAAGTLLKRPDDEPWTKTKLPNYFDKVVEGVKFNNKSKVTMYALRHTSIVRQLLANVPIRVVAALHDTSVKMIEQNYSEHIADHADELARPTLLETMAEVIALPPPSRKARAKKGVPEVPE